MKVLVQEGVELQGFERELKTALEQAKLAGYALMGFEFREALSSRLHAIDALVIMEPGTFVCLEAKGYKGKWTGSANEKWLSDNQEIKAVGINPYKQVERYSIVIKDKLQLNIFQNIQFWVNYFIVTPDKAQFEIEGAVINTFQPGKAIHICHVSKLEQVLGSIKASEKVAILFNEIGIRKVISEVVGISLEQIEKIITDNSETSFGAKSTDINSISEASTGVEIAGVEKTTGSEVAANNTNSVSKASIGVEITGVEKTTGSEVSKKRKTYIIPIGTCLSLAVILATGYHFWNKRPCEYSTETRINGMCYKDITKKPLVVGIITPPNYYSEFKTYLKNQLGSQAIDVLVEGNSELTYQEAQENIVGNKWDIVFANSPMNGMRARDSNYKWVARMYPKYPSTYQSVLFVRSDSSIKSIADINSKTKIALGDFNSASSFYMPVYDLYGKSMTVTAGHRSNKIRELVTNKQVDMGAVVYSTIKDDPQFRAIQISREIPSTGVYLSPKLTPAVQKQIQNILDNAPKNIKEQANYDIGEEPDYNEFRTIALRADEVLSCANFNINPVQFFCNATSQGIIGRVAGFTNQDNGMIRLRFERENRKACQVFVASQTLNKIKGGNSPEIINRKQVKIVGVTPIELEDSTCQITIENPSELIVLNQ